MSLALDSNQPARRRFGRRAALSWAARNNRLTFIHEDNNYSYTNARRATESGYGWRAGRTCDPDA